MEILGWALMGANVFLGLRFAVWSSTDPKRVAEATNKLLRSGLGKCGDRDRRPTTGDEYLTVADGLRLHYRDYAGRGTSRRSCAFTG